MTKSALIAKDAALINASYNLELSEQRLILMAIANARNTDIGIHAKNPVQISASDYANQFNVTNEAGYDALNKAVDILFKSQFTFAENYENTNQVKKVKSPWVSHIAYVKKFGILEITFSPDVVAFIAPIGKQLVSYELKQISQLKSKYSIRLYEILIARRTVKKVYLDLSDFKQKLGLTEEYSTMANFKRRVLEPAIKQINKYTDITVKYEQHKRSRIITGFSFNIEKKPKT